MLNVWTEMMHTYRMSLCFGKWVEDMGVVLIDIRDSNNIRLAFPRESCHGYWQSGVISKAEFRDELAQAFVKPDVTSIIEYIWTWENSQSFSESKEEIRLRNSEIGLQLGDQSTSCKILRTSWTTSSGLEPLTSYVLRLLLEKGDFDKIRKCDDDMHYIYSLLLLLLRRPAYKYLHGRS